MAVYYPSEFIGKPKTDYMKMSFIRRDYGAKKGVRYKKVDGKLALPDIVLNMPQKITETITQNYQNSALGELSILNAFGNRQNLAGGAAGSGALGNMLSRVVEEAVLNTAVEVGNKVGATGLSANGLLSGASGIVFNPSLEVLYEGPDFRTFNFQFAMFTKSATDAMNIKLIIDTFKKASLPSRSGEVADVGRLTNLITTTTVAAASGNIGQGSAQALGALLKGKVTGKGGNYTTAVNTLAGSLSTLASGGLGGIGTAGGAFFNGKNRFIKQPPLILLQYMRGENKHPYIQSLLPAFINQVSFDYTPTGSYTQIANYGETDKATTVGVTVTLQLTEVTNVYADDYDDKGSFKPSSYPSV